MKNILLLFMALFIVISCDSNDDDAMMNAEAEEEVQTEAIAGDFVSDAHPTMGMVMVNEDQSKLAIKNFKTDDNAK